MKACILRGAATAISLAMTASLPATAQSMSLSCAFGQPQVHVLDATAGVSETPTGGGEISTLTLDFAALTFSLGSTSGRILVEPSRIIAMARQEAMSGLWEIDRRTGLMTAVGFLSDETQALFYRVSGQCSRQDGGGFPF